MSLPGSTVKIPITILWDTGVNKSLLLESTLPSTESFTGTKVLIEGVELESIRVPLHEVELQSSIVTGLVRVGVRSPLPVEGLSMILGNDLAGGKVTADPCVTMQPTISNETNKETSIYPACAVIRAMAQTMAQKEAHRDGATMFPEDNSLMTDDNQEELEPSEEIGTIPEVIVTNEPDPLRSQGSGSQPQNPSMPCSIDMTAKSSLISSQESDPTLAGVREHILSESEAAMTRVCYYKKDGLLMRKWSHWICHPVMSGEC